jgi:transcriptional regulator with PAS, ATPase and Fis domain
MQRYNKKSYKNVQTISKGVEDFLGSYNWPANVRELKNVIERAMILVEENTLLMEHLP